MKRHHLILPILAAAAVPPFGAARAGGMQPPMHPQVQSQPSASASAARAGTATQAPGTTTTMGAPARALLREQVRAQAIEAMRQGTITRGEKGGFPQ